MKKYVLGVLFFLGCFFLSLTNTNSVSADSIANVVTDPYDSRVVTINLSGLSPRTAKLEVNEVAFCHEGEVGCNSYFVGGETKHLRILDTEVYKEVSTTGNYSVSYRIESTGDGDKYLYIVPYHKDGNNLVIGDAYVCLLAHKLSTLNQRITINPDAQGNPLHVYNSVQYSSVRKLTVDISLYDDEYPSYSGIGYICEEFDNALHYCSEYVLNGNVWDYYITSYGDGEKIINIYLVNTGVTILTSNDLSVELSSKARLISKKIYLDTIGPEITIEGGNWVFVEAGKKYTPGKATCQDAVFKELECVVDNDANVVKINYTNPKYQIITYTAKDELGNVSSATVKVKVEILEEDSSWGTWLIISGTVLLVTGLILGWVLIKNNEKKKKLSYI